MYENEKIFPPRHVSINNYIYAYKDALINNVYTYKCKYLSVCNVFIKINKDNLSKYINNPDNNDNEFTFASKNELHKYNQDNNENKNKIVKKDISTQNTNNQIFNLCKFRQKTPFSNN